VRFRDPVPQGELFNLFQDYDIYLFPSLYEPFALTLIYALHAGIPTIASDIGGNPEIIFDEKTGLLFSKNNAPDMKDKVIILYRSGVKRANISRNAKKMAWENNFNRMLANIDEFLRS
jgi:glycosyltransferase involved in cell wall biosynthesis